MTFLFIKLILKLYNTNEEKCVSKAKENRKKK